LKCGEFTEFIMFTTNAFDVLANTAINDAEFLNGLVLPGNVGLIQVPFTPGRDPGLKPGDVCDEAGLTAIVLPTVGFETAFDPLTGSVGMYMKEPLGGFNWRVTVLPAEPVVIYGYGLFDKNDVCFATELFPEPIAITAPQQVVSISSLFGWASAPMYTSDPAHSVLS
jgi:hypothetical protein